MTRATLIFVGYCLLCMTCGATAAPDPREGVFAVELPYESVEWPNWEAFVALGQSEEYQKIAHLREIGLENSLLIRCDRLP